MEWDAQGVSSVRIPLIPEQLVSWDTWDVPNLS